MEEPQCSQTKCSKGKHMKKHNATHIVCVTCEAHTFTAADNHLEKCHPCRECSSFSNLITDVECGPDRNTQCKCKPGFYCNNPSQDSCDHCTPVSKCPPGNGVTEQYTHLVDTKCRPCPKGTYSDVEDYISSCKNYTSCEALGRELKVPGTAKTDAKCGDFTACSPSLSCNWVLPAGLWAGFVVTALIIFLTLFIIYWRTKRRAQRSVIISEYRTSLPALPPDILKYPAEFGVEKQEECIKCILTEDNAMYCKRTCDIGATPVRKVSEKYESTAANQHIDSITFHSIYQSEPQESEWHE